MTSILVDAQAALDILKEASPPAMQKLISGLGDELLRLQQVEQTTSALIDWELEPDGNRSELIEKLAYMVGHQEYIRSIKD